MILLLNDTAGTQAAADPGLSGLAKVLLDSDVVSLFGCVLVALVMLVYVVQWLMFSNLLGRAEAADAEFTKAFRNSAHALGLFQNGETFDGSPRSALYTNTCRELAFQLLGSDVVDKNFSIKLRTSGRIVPSQWEATQRAARRSLDESARWFSSRLRGHGGKSLLALGLATSLLAIMAHAGTNPLGAATAAASLRPLALALLCYAIGLSWNQWVVRRTEGMVGNLADFYAELGMLMNRTYVDHRQPMEVLPSLEGMGMTDEPDSAAGTMEAVRRGNGYGRKPG
jgi:hypothetical protein